MKDLMLDLETLGNGNNAVIVQIGACYFSRATGKVGNKFLINVDIQSALDIGLSITGSTIAWWLNQEKEAQLSLLQNPVKIHEALTNFNAFAKKAKAVWSHATFDFVILLNAYLKAGITPCFHYRTARDIRTLVDLARITKADVSAVRVGTHHNALDDCITQVSYVTKAINSLTPK